MPRLPELQYPKQWEQTQIARFDAVLEQNIESLLREKSTEYNFLEIKPKVQYVIEQTKLVAQNYEFWEQLSETKRNALNSALDDMKVQFESMTTFDPKQNNAWNTRVGIVEGFNNRYNTFYDAVISPLNSYLGTKAYTQELTSKFGEQAKKKLDEIERIGSEIENIHTSVQQAATIAGDVASTANSASFGEQAEEHKKSAEAWLRSLFICSVITLGIALTVVVDFFHEIHDAKFQPSAEGYIVKVAVLAFLYVGLRFLMKNYSAHQHLYIVNKQRANILKSMEAFRTSALTDEAKDSILLAAVGAAFSQQETGFITTKEGAGSDDGDIMSIVETALKK